MSKSYLGLTLVLLAGCGEDAPSNAGPSVPTWHQDVAPLVAGKCSGCHQPGGIAPFSLTTYAEAAMFGGYMAGVAEGGSMPPFLARDTAECQPRFGFKEDLRLTPQQIKLLRDWHDADEPEGDPNKAAPLPQAPALELTDAEVTVTIPTPITISQTQAIGSSDRFVCFSLAPDLSPLAATGATASLLGDRVLVSAVQVRPGNAKIVHHVLVYTDEQSESVALAGDQGYYDCFGGPMVSSPGLIMAWAPGGTPIRAPDKVGMLVPSTGRLVMQVHYHPTGGAPETDSGTSLQLRGYGEGVPEYVAELALIGNASAGDASGMGLQPGPADASVPEFKIPAGARGHTETIRYQLGSELPEYRIWAVGTHMHYLGTDMRIGITRPSPGSEPAEECLLQTPSWNFNWQRGYLLDTPIDSAPSAKPGDIVNLRCTYDNSTMNPFVNEALGKQGLTAPRDVTLGEETLDEMCLGVFGIAQKVEDLLQ